MPITTRAFLFRGSSPVSTGFARRLTVSPIERSESLLEATKSQADSERSGRNDALYFAAVILVGGVQGSD